MKITQVAFRALNRAALHINKVSPEIFTGVGVAGLVTAGVMACYVTYKNLDDVVAEHEERMNKIETVYNDQSFEYSEDDYKKDKFIVGFDTCKAVAKLYLTPVLLGAASIALVAKGHSIMVKRNAALMVAYDALSKAFDGYRNRVKEELGEEAERDIHYNLKEAKTVVKENTEKHPGCKKKMNVSDYSQYARFFDSANRNWSKTPEFNMMFLKAQQNAANDMLLARGHVFLNEVYDMLGIPRSQAGAVVGWILDKDHDNFIDFGIFNINSEAARAFVNGDEDTILLDFNVDGLIYDKI